MAAHRRPQRTPHLNDFPRAIEAAQGYLDELELADVPFVVNPDWDDDTGKARGFDVGVDLIGNDGFSHWLVMNFREDGLHGEGYVIRHSLPGPTFERTSMSVKAMAEGLARCRAGKAFPTFVDRGTFKTLEFVQR